MKHVIVIGGGAAGMMAAIGAAREGARVTLLEKNEKLGKKIYITGKGRCNLTNACDIAEFPEKIVSNASFALSALHGFDNTDTIELFESLGMSTKTERGKRVFPVSDKASDVTKALEKELRRLGVGIRFHAEVAQIVSEPVGTEPDEADLAASAAEESAKTAKAKKPSKKKKYTATARATGVQLRDGTVIPADAVIVATGGLSYPTTGSTGDGYRMASRLGHSVTRLQPSLVSLTTEETWCADLAGLTLRNAAVTYKDRDGRKIYEDFGEILFTHKGISGPVVLTATAVCGDILAGGTAVLDVKPALTAEQLDARLVRDLSGGKAKQMGNLIGALVPTAFGEVLLRASGIPADKTAGEVTKEERRRLGLACKALELHIKCLGGFNEAVVTKGGVSTDEIVPQTMESRLVKGLFFAGEVIHIDAVTGGFNLQLAWSTGMLAGRKAARESQE